MPAELAGADEAAAAAPEPLALVPAEAEVPLAREVARALVDEREAAPETVVGAVSAVVPAASETVPEAAPRSEASPVAAAPPPVAVRVGAMYPSAKSAFRQRYGVGGQLTSARDGEGLGGEVLRGTSVVLGLATLLEGLKVGDLRSAGVVVGGVAAGAVVDVGQVRSLTCWSAPVVSAALGHIQAHATSPCGQVSNEHWKKHCCSAWGQAVLVEVKSEARAAELLSLRHDAQPSASDG